jgi:hypothetical protein
MAKEVIKTTFQVKRANKETWIRVNPVLAPGEPGCELDTHLLKMGDGVTKWSDLPYVGVSTNPGEGVDLAEYLRKDEWQKEINEIQKTFLTLNQAEQTFASWEELNNHIATQNSPGLVKGSKEIEIAEDGSLSVASINFNKLEQTENDIIILNCGNAN